MALPDPSQGSHDFVMRQCDTVRVPDMTPLHGMHMETPLSPLPNRPLGAVHSAPFFFCVRPAGRTRVEVKVLYSPGKGKS